MKNNGIRYCKGCGEKLVKNGKYGSNKQRGYCFNCHKSTSFSRKDIKEKLGISKKFKYLTSSKRQSDFGVDRSTFYRNTKNLLTEQIFIPATGEVHNVIYIDGLRVNESTYLIARNNKYVIGFMLVKNETCQSGMDFICHFPAPKYVVCDGLNGMLKAISTLGVETKVQRCVFHIGLNIKSKLTLNPQSICSQELLLLSKQLLNIFSIEQRNQGLNSFKVGEKQYKDYVSERSFNSQEEGFTHKRLRSAATQLKKLIGDQSIFKYLDEPALNVNRTNNPLEGGINSPLRGLLNSHRGMSFKNQQKVVELYLLKRSEIGAEISHIFAT